MPPAVLGGLEKKEDTHEGPTFLLSAKRATAENHLLFSVRAMGKFLD